MSLFGSYHLSGMLRKIMKNCLHDDLSKVNCDDYQNL